MDNTRILLIKLSPFNALDSATMRMLALIKGLVELGYSIDCITVPIQDFHVKNDLSKYHFLDGVNFIVIEDNSLYHVVRKNKKRPWFNSFIQRVKKIYHSISVYDYSYSLAQNIDYDKLGIGDSYKYVISLSDPKTSHIAARRLMKKMHYDYWIQYWGDPLLEDITRKDKIPNFIVKGIENRMLSGADKICYCSPFTLHRQQLLFKGESGKMRFVPTAYIDNVTCSKETDKFIIGYYGAYKSKIRNIKPVYDAVEALGEKYHLYIIGDSDEKFESKENITVLERQPVDEFMSKTDLFICVFNNTGYQIPGKFYHYAATNRPVLVVLNDNSTSEMIDFVNSFGRYHICMNDKNDIERAIVECCNTKDIYEPYPDFSSINVAKRIIDME